MTRRTCKLSVAEAINMSNASRSTRSIFNHYVIVSLLQRHVNTGIVNERPSSGKPCPTIRCDDRLLIHRAKVKLCTPAPQLRHP